MQLIIVLLVPLNRTPRPAREENVELANVLLEPKITAASLVELEVPVKLVNMLL